MFSMQKYFYQFYKIVICIISKIWPRVRSFLKNFIFCIHQIMISYLFISEALLEGHHISQNNTNDIFCTELTICKVILFELLIILKFTFPLISIYVYNYVLRSFQSQTHTHILYIFLLDILCSA